MTLCTPHYVPYSPQVQVGALHHLQELTLVDMSAEADGYAALAQLHPTLTALKLTNLAHLPGCLAQLTGLCSLGESLGWAVCPLVFTVLRQIPGCIRM